MGLTIDVWFSITNYVNCTIKNAGFTININQAKMPGCAFPNPKHAISVKWG
jgi:hypothetical protein